ncbi:unnamed protein product [Paramecium sonneborni]|uniref:Transmembrane protein n=1 Tax=Paramecium sonneborni TaxID=65129 RepID=A0A8S1PIH9_9CILI|nr:unnamed protein product [Paramecium sonneborni]
MNNQDSFAQFRNIASNQLNLYFNPNHPSVQNIIIQGFELCEKIIPSETNIFYRPINKDDGLIYSKISKQGQNYLQQHIQLYNIIITKFKDDQNQINNNIPREPNNQQAYQSNYAEFEMQIINKPIISNLFHQISEYPSETEIILRQYIDKQIFEFDKVDDNSVTFCLIYDDQDLNEINRQILRFKQIFDDNRSTNIVIIVNGKEKMKKHNLGDHFQIMENINENKCNICYSFEYLDSIFLVIYEEKTPIKLINWIYQGVFKHFQSEYFYVGFLNIIVDSTKFQSMDNILRSSQQFCGATGYINLVQEKDKTKCYNLNSSFVGYMNFLNYQFQIDSLASLKRFHNPFFSYYKWNLCFQYLDQYLKKLEIESSSGNINLYLNSLFPSLVYENETLQFLQLSSPLGETQIDTIDTTKLFLELSNKLKCIAYCNNQAYGLTGLKYKIIVILRFFENQVKLAEILFLFTFSPYQLFYQNTSNIYLQILLAIVWPLLLFILIALFVLLTQQYSIGVSIVKKKTRQIYLKLTDLKNLKILFKQKIITINNIFVEIQNYDDQQPIVFKLKQKVYQIKNLYKELRQKFKKEIQQNQQFKSETERNIQIEQIQKNQQDESQEESLQILNAQQEQYFVYSTQIISEKKVDILYQKLFLITQMLEICCSITIIMNLIFTYGRNLITEIENQQQYVTILGTFIFVIVFLLRNLSTELIRSILMTLQIFINSLITIVYSEMYHLLRIPIKPQEYRRQIKKLSQYFCINILFLMIFYIVETQMNFEGYIYSIIIFYNLAIYFIDSLIIISAKINEFLLRSASRNNQIRQQKSEIQHEMFCQDYQIIIFQYLNDLSSKQKEIQAQIKDKTVIIYQIF